MHSIVEEILLSGTNILRNNPHDILGIHKITNTNSALKNSKNNSSKTEIVIRAFLQNTDTCSVINKKTKQHFAMTKIHQDGLFECILHQNEIFEYKLQITDFSGNIRTEEDPYRFLPTISEFDCYLFNQGKHLEIYNKLGSHIIEHQGIIGTQFAVWAPNAMYVSVVGDFNNWDGRYNPMRKIGSSGVWEIFIPKNLNGEKYKYEIIGTDSNLRLKSDPYAQYFEPSPNNASIVFRSNYNWNDTKWTITKRNFSQDPISIYEVHLNSWMHVPEENNRPLTYREIAHKLSEYCSKNGFTHVEFLPITEYPFLGSWGYQVTGYFATTHRYGTPDDFRYLIDILHNNNIGVIIDWVPAHFPKDSFALEYFDGTHLYEHADPKQGQHQDWGTLIFNYGRHEVRNFLLASALFFITEMHIDGIRIDAVASMLYLDYSRKPGEWIPNQYGGHENIEAIEFLRELNTIIHEKNSNVMMIAEESTSFGGVTRPVRYYGLGFDMKWNMGWMHDTLKYFSQPTLLRKYFHNQLTFGMLYQNSERFLLSFSHDEVVHGKSSLINKMPEEDMSKKSQHLRSLYGFMWGWPGKKLLFMGNEFGQSNEWNYAQSLDWHLLKYTDHSGIQKSIRELNKIYKNYKFLHESDFDPNNFEWAVVDDSDNSVIAFLRKGKNGEKMLIVCNFTPVTRENYRIGIENNSKWRCIFDSDWEIFGGNNKTDDTILSTDSIISHGKMHSLSLKLPGVCTQFFELLQ